MGYLNEVLIISFSYVDAIFPSFIVTDNNRAYSIFNTIINNKSGGFMNVIVYFLMTFMCKMIDAPSAKYTFR